MHNIRMEIVEAVDGSYIVLVDGFQWGKGPYDRSGCSSETWPTMHEAQLAFNDRTKVKQPPI